MTLEMEFRRIERLAREEECGRMICKLSNMHMSIKFIAEVTERSPEFTEKVLLRQASQLSKE